MVELVHNGLVLDLLKLPHIVAGTSGADLFQDFSNLVRIWPFGSTGSAMTNCLLNSYALGF